VNELELILLPSSFFSVTDGILSPSPLKTVNENKEIKTKERKVVFMSKRF